MSGLDRFALSDMVRHGSLLRRMGADATCMEAVANELVSHIYESFADEDTGQRSCALVRFFKSHEYSCLPPRLQAIARESLGGEPVSESMKCLALLATRGEQPGWNAIADSVAHQVIPLPSAAAVREMPMVIRLVEQLGIEVETFLAEELEPIIDITQTTYNVFHVSDATESPYVPARDFVRSAGIRSVLGFGGLLSSGELYCIIMFCKVRVPREVAALFPTLALNMKMAVEPFAGQRAFVDHS